ncbi:hypothetical protein LZ554_004985 [Drepanopeziza brunnea f. sp. 'monogermtubi']|nr:hypothetical protein LZ554_004985 [Drepanopeziza brunnea f. sp. 'monogermtubi']
MIAGMPLDSSVMKRYKLGPLVSSGLWRGQRAGMDMNRGPYGPLEFVEAMATNEMQFVKMLARPRMNYHRSSTEPELPEEALDLLHKYLRLAPAMVPPLGMDDTHSPTLWHPDSILFIEPGSKQITRIIDWQSAAAMPLFYQCGIPRMFLHPGIVWALSELPKDYSSLDQNKRTKIDRTRESGVCHKYYEAETKSKNPRHWAALRLDNADVRTEPSRLVVNVWEDRDIFFLRRALLSIVEQWQDLCPKPDMCPVRFSEQELALHVAEEESTSNVGEILRLFQENWGLAPNGMVDPAQFDQIRAAVIELRTSFIEDADDEAERELFARLWPYQDAEI